MRKFPAKGKLKRIGYSTALAAGLTIGGFGIANAASSTSTPQSNASNGPTTQSPPLHMWRGGGHDFRGGPMGGGTVSSIGTNSFTLKTLQGTSITVNTTSSTTYEKDGQSVTASALSVGEHVSILPVRGSITPSSTPPTSISAASVEIMSPSLAGTVISVNGSTITISDLQGFYRTVNTSASTNYESGTKASTASSVTVGSRIIAFGSIDSNHTALDAATIEIVPAGNSNAPGPMSGNFGEYPPMGGPGQMGGPQAA